MKRISIDHPDAINHILLALKNNQVIAYPTDTIYGIGTDIDNDLGIKKINQLKEFCEVELGKGAIVCNDTPGLSRQI